jgi:hypothetical protein
MALPTCSRCGALVIPTLGGSLVCSRLGCPEKWEAPLRDRLRFRLTAEDRGVIDDWIARNCSSHSPRVTLRDPDGSEHVCRHVGGGVYEREETP